MRVIAGKYRGRIIKMPVTFRTRPTQDRVREAVFNVMAKAVPGSRALDLYAGSGAFGIESISRGALTAAFMDNNAKCIKTIAQNLKALGIGREFTQVLKMEAVKGIEKLSAEGARFNMVFLDPPYHKDMAKNCLINISACDILTKHSFVIAEHFVKDELPDRIGSLLLFKRNKYGDTVISFYKND